MRTLLLTLTLLTAALWPFHANPNASLYATTLNQSVARLESEEYLCTTFMVAKDEFLTALHCIHQEPQTIIDQFNMVYPMEVVRQDADTDLALLKAHVPTKSPIVLAPKFEKGEDVMAVGFMFVLGESLPFQSTGHVVNFNPLFIALDTPLRQGFSGGPVVNQKGQLIGMSDATDMMHGIGLAISLDVIKAFLAVHE